MLIIKKYDRSECINLILYFVSCYPVNIPYKYIVTTKYFIFFSSEMLLV